MDNTTLARRFVMEHNQADYLRSFDELLSPTCLVHEYLPGLPAAMNRAFYNQFIAGFRASLPDIRNQIEDVITSGDRAVIRWTGYGTHTGADLMGVPAAGKPVEAHGVYIFRFEGECIAEVWNNWDNLLVLQQLQGN